MEINDKDHSFHEFDLRKAMDFLSLLSTSNSTAADSILNRCGFGMSWKPWSTPPLSASFNLRLTVSSSTPNLRAMLEYDSLIVPSKRLGTRKLSHRKDVHRDRLRDASLAMNGQVCINFVQNPSTA